MKAIRTGALVLAGLFLAVLSSAVRADMVFEDNFDSSAVGVPPEGWVERYDNFGGSQLYTRNEAEALGVTVQVNDSVSFAGGRSVHFLDTSTGTSPGVGSDILHNFTPTSSVVLEYYIRSDNPDYQGAFVDLMGDGGTDYMVGFSNGAGGGREGYLGVFGWNGGWIHPLLLPYEDDAWYYVRRELDCTTNTGTFYVQEVGNPTNAASYSIGSNYLNTYIDRIRVITSNSTGADAYVDSLRISGGSGAVPLPGSILLLGMGLAGLVGLRKRLLA